MALREVDQDQEGTFAPVETDVIREAQRTAAYAEAPRVGFWRPRAEASVWRQSYNGSASAPTIAKQRRALRAMAVYCLRVGLMESMDHAYLPREQTWYRRTPDGSWRPFATEELRGACEEVLQALQVGVSLHSSGDVGRVYERMCALRTPRAAAGIAEDDWQSAWGMDTGVVHAGMPMRDQIVRVTEQGTIATEPLTPTIFVRAVLPFGWTEADAVPLPPKFGAFLDAVMPDRADQDAFCRIVGCMLAGDAPSAQGLLFLRGVGRSGKGTMMRLVECLFGEACVASEREPGALTGRFATYRLLTARLLTIHDIPQRPSRGSERAAFDGGMGVIKNLTGRDRIDAEVKFGERISFRPSVAVGVVSNHRLAFARGAEDAKAWGERIWMFDFPREVEAVPITDYEQTVLAEEHAGIFAFCLNAYAAMKGAHGAVPPASAFRSPAMTERIGELVRDAEGDVGRFFHEQCTITDPEGALVAYTSKRDLRAALGAHLGKDPTVGHLRSFYALLEAHGAVKTRSQGEDWFTVQLGAVSDDD